MSIFIHVGLHKTATTFLQQEIFPKLSKTACITQKYILQNHAFNKLMYADDSLYDVQPVKQEIAKINSDRLILSEENFSGTRNVNFLNRSAIAKRLSQLFPEAEIIVFLRGQENMLCSLYNQAVKIGKTSLPIEKFIWRSSENVLYEQYLEDKQIAWDKNRMYYNASQSIHPEQYLYFELVNLYHSLFKKVHVFLYEEFQENPQSVVERILAILNDRLVDVNRDIFSKNVNFRLSAGKLKLKRYENKLRSAGLANNKYILKASVLALSALERKDKERESDRDYVRKLIGNFYVENNQKLINEYPHIPLTKYPESYQF